MYCAMEACDIPCYEELATHSISVLDKPDIGRESLNEMP